MVTPSSRVHPPDPLIELRGVRKTFPTPNGDFHALRDITLTVDRGEFVAVVGKSGSGKSTLLNVIAGIDDATGGEVIVGGTPVHTLGQDRLAAWRGRNVGVVFQFFQLLPTLSVLENILLAMDFVNVIPGREREERARGLLNLVGVEEQADKLPASLSGGQQQRAAIARALANDPPLLVADEPTGNLDSRTADLVLSLFRDLVHQGKTLLMVTHERDVSAYVTRTVTIADGRLVQDGSEHQVLATGEGRRA